MKNLAAVAALALVLAGCGAQPTALPQVAGKQALAASATHPDHQLLYGIVVTAKVRDARLTAYPSGKVVTATIDVIEAENGFDGSRVKGRVRITIGGPLNRDLDLAEVKPGRTIQAFINYPLIDRKTHTIVAQSRPYSSHGVELLQGE